MLSAMEKKISKLSIKSEPCYKFESANNCTEEKIIHMGDFLSFGSNWQCYSDVNGRRKKVINMSQILAFIIPRSKKRFSYDRL